MTVEAIKAALAYAQSIQKKLDELMAAQERYSLNCKTIYANTFTREVMRLYADLDGAMFEAGILAIYENDSSIEVQLDNEVFMELAPGVEAYRVDRNERVEYAHYKVVIDGIKFETVKMTFLTEEHKKAQVI